MPGREPTPGPSWVVLPEASQSTASSDSSPSSSSSRRPRSSTGSSSSSPDENKEEKAARLRLEDTFWEQKKQKKRKAKEYDVDPKKRPRYDSGTSSSEPQSRYGPTTPKKLSSKPTNGFRHESRTTKRNFPTTPNSGRALKKSRNVSISSASSWDPPPVPTTMDVEFEELDSLPTKADKCIDMGTIELTSSEDEPSIPPTSSLPANVDQPPTIDIHSGSISQTPIDLGTIELTSDDCDDSGAEPPVRYRYRDEGNVCVILDTDESEFEEPILHPEPSSGLIMVQPIPKLDASHDYPEVLDNFRDKDEHLDGQLPPGYDNHELGTSFTSLPDSTDSRGFMAVESDVPFTSHPIFEFAAQSSAVLTDHRISSAHDSEETPTVRNKEKEPEELDTQEFSRLAGRHGIAGRHEITKDSLCLPDFTSLRSIGSATARTMIVPDDPFDSRPIPQRNPVKVDSDIAGDTGSRMRKRSSSSSRTSSTSFQTACTPGENTAEKQTERSSLALSSESSSESIAYHTAFTPDESMDADYINDAYLFGPRLVGDDHSCRTLNLDTRPNDRKPSGTALVIEPPASIEDNPSQLLSAAFVTQAAADSKFISSPVPPRSYDHLGAHAPLFETSELAGREYPSLPMADAVHDLRPLAPPIVNGVEAEASAASLDDIRYPMSPTTYPISPHHPQDTFHHYPRTIIFNAQSLMSQATPASVLGDAFVYNTESCTAANSTNTGSETIVTTQGSLTRLRPPIVSPLPLPLDDTSTSITLPRRPLTPRSLQAIINEELAKLPVHHVPSSPLPPPLPLPPVLRDHLGELESGLEAPTTHQVSYPFITPLLFQRGFKSIARTYLRILSDAERNPGTKLENERDVGDAKGYNGEANVLPPSVEQKPPLVAGQSFSGTALTSTSGTQTDTSSPELPELRTPVPSHPVPATFACFPAAVVGDEWTDYLRLEYGFRDVGDFRPLLDDLDFLPPSKDDSLLVSQSGSHHLVDDDDHAFAYPTDAID